MVDRWWVIHDANIRNALIAVQNGATAAQGYSLLEEWIESTEDFSDEGGSELVVTQ